MDVRSLAMMFAGLMMGVAAIAPMAGCTPSTAQQYACPAGVPWVPDDYANGAGNGFLVGDRRESVFGWAAVRHRALFSRSVPRSFSSVAELNAEDLALCRTGGFGDGRRALFF